MEKIKEGEKAPNFKGIDQNGNEIELKKLKGQKVILYFYPKDNTPGCTAQACNLRDNQAALKKAGFIVVGVSPDSIASHEKFATKFELDFPLLPDESKEIIKAYGVWGQKNMYGKIYEGVLRTTFVIDEQGMVEKDFSKVETANHSEQILKALKK